MTALVLDFEPGKGFGPISLGSLREDARSAMAGIGLPLETSRGDMDYFCESSIQTECDEQGRVMFVGVACHKAFVARYRGVDVFETLARDLFQLVAQADVSGHHEFDPLEYCFPNQVLTLWDADEQYDCRGRGSRQVWGQVGVGNSVYLAAIKAFD
jgi:hypothetical protein